MMQELTIPSGAVILSRIEIVHFMVDDDVVVATMAQDASGETLDTITTLGMLEMAKNFKIQEEFEDDDGY